MKEIKIERTSNLNGWIRDYNKGVFADKTELALRKAGWQYWDVQTRKLYTITEKIFSILNCFDEETKEKYRLEMNYRDEGERGRVELKFVCDDLSGSVYVPEFTIIFYDSKKTNYTLCLDRSFGYSQGKIVCKSYSDIAHVADSSIRL